MPRRARLVLRIIGDWLYNKHARLLRRPWYMRRPNYTGPLQVGDRFELPPGGAHNAIEILRLGNDVATIDPCVYWNRVGWPEGYKTCSRESEMRRMIGSDGKRTRK